MSGGVSVCQILRDGALAAMSAAACAASPPPPACLVLDLASKRDLYFQAKYTPANFLTPQVREKELAVLANDIAVDVAALESRYGAAAPVGGVTWRALPGCLWSPAGGPGGPNRNTHFERDDLTALGYQPQPALGGAALAGRLPAALTQAVPVGLDRVLNPDLAVVVIFVLLAALLAALLLRARRQQKRAAAPDGGFVAKSAEGQPGLRDSPGAPPLS